MTNCIRARYVNSVCLSVCLSHGPVYCIETAVSPCMRQTDRQTELTYQQKHFTTPDNPIILVILAQNILLHFDRTQLNASANRKCDTIENPRFSFLSLFGYMSKTITIGMYNSYYRTANRKSCAINRTL